MSGYTKLFGSILDSTVWELPIPTKITWITMLAMADQYGEVQASVPGLAKRAHVTLEECEAALASFLSPDKYSRSREAEGRRIEEVDGGWRLINHAKYTRKMSIEDKRERGAERQRRHRDKVRGASTDDIAGRDGFVCGICAKPINPWEAEIDHIIPRSKGGPDGIDNLQLAHPFCNQSKHNGRNGLLRHASLPSVTPLQCNKSNQGNDTRLRSDADQTQTKEQTQKRTLAPLVYESAFEEVWEATGRRGGKELALKAWRKRGKLPWLELRGVWTAYLASERPVAGYIKDLSSWLNAGMHLQRWEPAAPRVNGKPVPPRPTRPPGPPVAIAELAGERARQLAECAQAANQEAAERFKQQRESDHG